MSRPIQSFAKRAAEADKRVALESMTLTDRLLAHILIELMDFRRNRDNAEIAGRLKTVGMSMKQIAALLGTTEGSLNVVQRRKRLAQARTVDAIDPVAGRT